MSPLQINSLRRHVRRTVALAATVATLAGCGSWRGAANVSVPGGPGSSPGHYTIYLQMPDTLALNVNSRVQLADVNIGRVSAIDLKDWVATLTLEIDRQVKLPENAQAKIGQTSLLGSQHVELSTPQDPSPRLLHNGGTIPLKNASAFPTTERVLASIATVLRGGGIPNLEVIQNEIYNMVNGRGEEIREFLNKLDTFTGQLNEQRHDLTHAIDSSNRLLSIFADNNQTLDRVLTEFPPLMKHFADKKDLFSDAVQALGRLSKAADDALGPSAANLHTNLELLQKALNQLGCASPYLIDALKLLGTFPFNVYSVPKLIRGDYINVSATADLTLSSVDNALFSGTGISGMLRALEQSWGRDPSTMLPDIRFTPNPHDAPGGPLVERGTTC